MSAKDNFSSFFRENKTLAKEYIETRLEIMRLRMIRLVSQAAGSIVWAIVLLFLFSLLLIFGGLTTGFWLSEITGSYARGFGLTTLIILVIVLVVAALRKILFINPIIRTIISKSREKEEDEDHLYTNLN